MLYEMTCGVAPFSGLSGLAAARAQGQEAYPPPAHVAPGLPAELYDLIKGMLSADPAGRPADCDTVLRQLDVIYDQLVPPVVPDSPSGLPIDELQVPLEHVLALCAIPLASLLIGALVVL